MLNISLFVLFCQAAELLSQSPQPVRFIYITTVYKDGVIVGAATTWEVYSESHSSILNRLERKRKTN